MIVSVKKRVGIDLGPASYRAPGTARHVSEQAKALFQLDVPWEWVPLLESKENPLWQDVQSLNFRVNSGNKLWTRATFHNGKIWRNEGCQLAFATAYFVPWIGIPVVTNYYDSNNLEYGRTWIDSGKRWNFYLTNTLSYYALAKSKKLFVNSQYCINVIAKHFPSIKDKLVLTPPGITPAMPKPNATPPWAKNIKKPFYLYVGIFSDNKNQQRLIQAWLDLRANHSELPQLVLIGPHKNAYTDQSILPLLKNSVYSDEIIFPGKIFDEELAWAYHHAHAYVQPSIAEGFGLPIVEAMSYGLPVACSHTTSLPEAAGDAAHLFDPHSIKSIQHALSELAYNKELCSQLIEKGKHRPSLFTWKKNAEVIAEQIDLTLASLN